MRVTEALSTAYRQALAVGLMLAVSAGSAAAGSSWGPPVALAAGLLLLLIAAATAGLRCAERTRAIDLIVDGEEWLPLDAVRRQRRRLLSARTRAVLARSFESHARDVVDRRRSTVRSARPVYDRAVIAAVAVDLRAVAEALRRRQPTAVRGVAMAERLLIDGLGPFYGHDVDALRAELRRVLFLLSTSAGEPLGDRQQRAHV